MERSFLIAARQRPVCGPRSAAESPWLQLMRRLQLSGRFGRQINCARSRIATVAATPPFTTAATIVPELFRMLLVVRV